MSYLLKVRTLWLLGAGNVLRVVWYRLGLKTGLSSVVRAQPGGDTVGAFFSYGFQREIPAQVVGNLRWTSGHWAFGRQQNSSMACPDWHRNVVNSHKVTTIGKPWWKLPDFDPGLGDIKGVWEASRFDWVVSFAAISTCGNTEASNRLESWLSDWVTSNPAYCGVNWKCGQEASIRVIHLAIAHRLLGAGVLSKSLQALILTHLRRISPTTSYAKAQDNNHGTSEAGGLFIGGLLLAQSGVDEGSAFMHQGRALLEERVCRLIALDGSFSQHSVNYHRLMLDTLSLCELWRKQSDQPDFSPAFYQRARAATRWQYELLDILSGDAPVLGASDGAELLVLHGADYRDHRPSVHLAANLFLNRSAFSDLSGSIALDRGLDLDPCFVPLLQPVRSIAFCDGGYSVLRNEHMKLVFNYPRYRFRPIQSDALHVDLWAKGQNLLRDGGTYSYNASSELVDYFAGTASHNTVQFDDRDQMRKISRFLFADWLKPARVVPLHDVVLSGASTSAGYKDYRGAEHHRTVAIFENVLEVVDDIRGNFRKAVLRWRLIDADWVLENGVLESTAMKLEVIADCEIRSLSLERGRESRYYGAIDELTVLECIVNKACILITRITLK